jgi:hypothetical protein
MVDKFIHPRREQLDRAFPNNPRLVKFFEDLIALVNTNTSSVTTLGVEYSSQNLIGYTADNFTQGVNDLTLDRIFETTHQQDNFIEKIADVYQQGNFIEKIADGYQQDVLPPTPTALGTVADKNYIHGYYTPNISAAVGSFTSFTATGSFIRIGDLVTVTVEINITNAGTATGVLFVDLPKPAKNIRFIGVGRENALTGNMLQIIINPLAAEARVFTYNNLSVISTGALVNFTTTYFIG